MEPYSWIPTNVEALVAAQVKMALNMGNVRYTHSMRRLQNVSVFDGVREPNTPTVRHRVQRVLFQYQKSATGHGCQLSYSIDFYICFLPLHQVAFSRGRVSALPFPEMHEMPLGYTKLDDDYNTTETIHLSENTREEPDVNTFPIGDWFPIFTKNARRERFRAAVRRPLQVLGLVLFSWVFFGIGVAFQHVRGVDETACLDTAWGKPPCHS